MVNQVKHQWIIPTIIIFALFELFIDSQSPLGTADYIFYFVPVALCVLHHRPSTPFYIAFLASALITIGFYISPEAESYGPIALNRAFAAVNIWIVAGMVNLIIKNRNKNVDEDWLKSMINTVANTIRGEKTAHEIGVAILDQFSRDLSLKAGTVYLYQENKKHLEFIAGHAHLPEHAQTTIRVGEGLIGQSVLDKQQQLIQDVSDKYLKISSSLGEGKPVTLIVQPLIADDKVIAVMELAFMNEQNQLSLALVQQTSENIAIAIKSALSREQLSLLLNQAQQLTEELQAQQEELRVSNEELEQQTKALKESQVRLENQQAELEQSNQQLEEQTQILENQKQILDQKNRDLTISQQEVTRTSQYKSEFLANMSHELRTPLNSTMILAKLLSENKQGNLTEEQIRYADIILTSGNDLLNLINDILDLSKVEAGKMAVIPEVVDIQSLSKNIKALFDEQSKSKGLELKIVVDNTSPGSIITDRMRLEQILKNFMSNALKFTEKGLVQLQIYKDASGISFSVSDSGIGIPAEQLEVIFEAFRQVEGNTSRKYGGTGLGLSISRELANLLGGTITVKSTPGKGSTFILTLPQEYHEKKIEAKDAFPTPANISPPVSKPNEEKENAPQATFSFKDDRELLSRDSRKILIIEDDENFAHILFDLAHEMKFKAIVTSTAEEGIRLAQLHVPHAVLLDIRLPDHSGMLVLDQMKMNSRTRHIPVHVISATDFSKSAREMGAVGYMLKPVKREQLQMAFTNLSSIMGQKEKTVLVVEDDEVQRMHITNLISDAFVKVEAVENAELALKRLSEKTFDCMIMDLSLPDLSGYDLLSKLSNENRQYSYPPVIVYTARDLTRDEEDKLRQYSGSIIIKGAKSPERLLSEVTLFLHRVETELPPERQKMLTELRTRERSLEDRRILVVDDDVRNIFALTSALENYGAEIIVARNGREAIEKVLSTNVDIVLMDIMMPEMDGYEAMKRIRQNKKFENLPIIALTAKAMKDDQEKCIEAGANDYLPKPIVVDKLVSLIRVWLPHQRSFIS